MVAIDVSDDVYRQLTLLGNVLGTSPGGAVDHLLDRFSRFESDRVAQPGTQQGDRLVSIHAVYEGTRTDAVYDRTTGAVEIRSGRLAGRRFKSPSGAAIAVVQDQNPHVHPNRNGWTFWTDTTTGKLLQSLRHEH